MKNLYFLGQNLPVEINFHHLKRSIVQALPDKIVFTLCYDLGSKQQIAQIKILHKKLYTQTVKKVVTETLDLLQTISPRKISKIRYKTMRSRWGSASANNNLNFNLDLAKLPLHLQQYIIIHEYSHLFEMNHSAKFWAVVEKFNPTYGRDRRELRRLEKTFHLANVSTQIKPTSTFKLFSFGR